MNSPDVPDTAPPVMRAGNLALRFGLELAALGGIGLVAWNGSTGVVRWFSTVGAPLVAAAVWGTFNVSGDPSRSGRAPVEVSGRARLALELSILGGGWVAVGIAGHPVPGAGLAALTVVHYVVSRDRLRWLLERRQPST